jgi:DNA transformation protein
MFSGYGLYLDGMIFGIIAEGALYFKVDATNKDAYVALGSKPFSYVGGGRKTISLSYYEVPEEIVGDRERIEEWVRESANINYLKKKPRKK